MKKLLLIATVLCCFLSSMAQMPKENFSRQVESYTERLDSIDGGWYKYRFVYDNQYNIVTMEIKESGCIFYDQFAYDEQNRLKSVVQTDIDPQYSYRTEYVYDSLGRRSEELTYFLENGVVTLEMKTIYQYNEDNNVSIVIHSYYNAGTWVNDSKLEYSYDDQLDIAEILSYGNNSVNTWLLNGKTVNTYDNNHNCIETKQYYYEGEDEWWLENETHYYYDLNVPSNSIAGLDFMFYNRLYINGINHFCRNKLLYYEDWMRKRDGQFEKNRTTYYYSAITGIDENPEKLLNIWPNPVDKTLYLEAAELQQVEIFSMEGRSLLTSDGLGSIDVSTLSAGCYLLKAKMKDGRITMQKFVKH